MRSFILLLCLSVYTTGISQILSRDSITYWPAVNNLERKMWGNFPVEYKKALNLHQQILGSSCARCQARSYYIIGKFQWADGLYKDAIQNFGTAMEMAAVLHDQKTQADAIDLIATSYYYQGYYDSALQFYGLAEKLYKEDNNAEALIIISNNISLVHHRKGDYKNAILRILETEKLKDVYKKQVAELDPFVGMSGLMIDSIYYKEEIEDVKRDLKDHIVEKDTVAIYRSYFNLSKAYDRLNEHHKSIGAQREANRLMKLLHMIPYHDEIAHKYRRLGMQDSCFYFHRLSIQEFPKMTQLSISYIWEQMGESHLLFKTYDSAIYYFEKALSANTRLNNRITVAGIHHKMAEAHLGSNNLIEARKYVLNGIPLAKLVSLSHLVKLFDVGSRVYEKSGDYKRAHELKTSYAVLKDSINTQETTLGLIKLQTQFQTAKKIKEIQDLQEANALHKVQAQSRNLQIVLVLLLLIVFSIIGGMYYSRYIQKKRSTERLEAQKLVIEVQNENLKRANEEKETLLSEIHHRVKNNLQIISSLINLKSRGSSSETQDILLQLNGRILSMGLIHERLYNTTNIQSIRLDEYLIELAETLVSSIGGTENRIKLKFDVDPITMEAESALTFGLICNELITNSIKYAFIPDQITKQISLNVKAVDTKLQIDFADNGIPKKNSSGVPSKAFGLRFVDQLIHTHLLGEWKYSLDNGFRANILVPLFRSEKYSPPVAP